MKKSRKKRGVPKWERFDWNDLAPLARAELCLTQAHGVLRVPLRYQPEEWMLLAGLIAEAENDIREAQADDPDAHLSLFDTVMEEFRDATANFTNIDFLQSTRAVRRRWKAFYSGLI